MSGAVSGKQVIWPWKAETGGSLGISDQSLEWNQKGPGPVRNPVSKAKIEYQYQPHSQHKHTQEKEKLWGKMNTMGWGWGRGRPTLVKDENVYVTHYKRSIPLKTLRLMKQRML